MLVCLLQVRPTTLAARADIPDFRVRNSDTSRITVECSILG